MIKGNTGMQAQGNSEEVVGLTLLIRSVHKSSFQPHGGKIGIIVYLVFISFLNVYFVYALLCIC